MVSILRTHYSAFTKGLPVILLLPLLMQSIQTIGSTAFADSKEPIPPAPGTQAEFGALTKAWVDSGAKCPK